MYACMYVSTYLSIDVCAMCLYIISACLCIELSLYVYTYAYMCWCNVCCFNMHACIDARMHQMYVRLWARMIMPTQFKVM